MQQTIFTLITDETLRNPEAITAALDEEFSVGAPWFDKSSTELLDQDNA